MRISDAVTFIELLLVTIIISILVGVSIPRFRRTFNALQINSFSQELQAFMNYLQQRAIVEGKIICFNVDNDKNEYWAQFKDEKNRLKTYRAPGEIEIEQKQIMFYPDGSIDKATIKLINQNGQYISLTTEGIFGGVKLQYKE